MAFFAIFFDTVTAKALLSVGERKLTEKSAAGFRRPLFKTVSTSRKESRSFEGSIVI